MKKFAIMLSVISLMFLVAGCDLKLSKDEEKIMNCTAKTKDVINNYEYSSTFEVHYKGTIVSKVITKEAVVSEDEDILTYFEENLEKSYSSMNKAYGGYTYKILNENGKVTSDVTIDYTVLNTVQLVKDTPSMKSVIDSKNRVTLEGIESTYKSMGATCTK